MIRYGNAVSSRSALISSKTSYEKRGGLFWPIARKNLITLRSTSFFTMFVCNLVHVYKFQGYLKTAWYKKQKQKQRQKVDNSKISHQFTSPTFKDIENMEDS